MTLLPIPPYNPPMSSNGGLNPKQKLFVAEYLKDKNGKQAAIRAGYSPKTAEVQASRLLSVVKVKAAVDEALGKVHKKLDISAERIREELARMAFADMADYVDIGVDGSVRVKSFGEMPEGSSRAIAGIKERRVIRSGDDGDTFLEATLEYKHHDKLRALELLGKDQGMFKERVEVDFPDEKPQIDEAERKVAERLKKIKGKK